MLIYSHVRRDLGLHASLAARVLVIDDEALIRWSLCEGLTAAGIDAVPAATLADVRRLAAEPPAPRVALLDRRFTGASERLLMATIVASAPRCRFFVMTTNCYDSSPVALAHDAAVIEKPFDIRRIVAHVRALLGTLEAGSP